MIVDDKELACRDCRHNFVWTAGEQKFFEERKFTPPTRCKQCRDNRKASAPGRDATKEPVVQRVAERYQPEREARSHKYDNRQDWPDAKPSKFDRYASKRRRRRHERDEDDDW